MEPRFRLVQPRTEVRQVRSFNPDDFALEQVVIGTAPLDYKDPARFFERNVFTRAVTEHASVLVRRVCGHTANAAPMHTLIT